MIKIKYVIIPILAISALLFISACGGGSKSSNPNPDEGWKIGSISEYAIAGGSAVTIADSLTGIDFEFPEGGSGSLSIGRIESGPEAPFDGEGFSLNYNGSDCMLARISKEGAYCVTLMGYGTSEGSRDNRGSDDWRAIAETGSTATEAVFELQPLLSSKSGFSSIAMHDGFAYHWISKIPSGSNDAVRLAAIKTQANEFIGHYLDSLPASLKTAATNAYHGRLAPTFYADDNYYIGFTRRNVIGNSTTPMIGIIPSASSSTVAHEVGHYMHHVLVGDAVYLQIENSAPDNHGVGDLHYKRLSIIEDMAYFGQYYLLGHVNSTDAAEPGLLMRGKDPELTDYPSLEGFACCLLARLKSTNDKIRDVEFTSEQRDFPVIGAPFSDIFGIIARGAVNVDQLRGHIKDYLVSKGQGSKYPVFLERTGWHYISKAKIVNEDGDPVVNASVKCVCKDGATEYFTRTDNGYTDSNGETSYIEVFPDSSFLRVEYIGKSHDIPIYIDPDGPTNVLVELGTLEIKSLDLSRFTRFAISGYVNAKYKRHSSTQGDAEYWTYISFNVGNYLSGSFTGSTFTAEWDTAIYANPVNDSGSAMIVINVQSNSLVSAQASFIEPSYGHATKREYSIKIGAMYDPQVWDDYELSFYIEGENACLFIEALNYRTYNDEGLDWYELLDYDCDEESSLFVTVRGY